MKLDVNNLKLFSKRSIITIVCLSLLLVGLFGCGTSCFAIALVDDAALVAAGLGVIAAYAGFRNGDLFNSGLALSSYINNFLDTPTASFINFCVKQWVTHPGSTNYNTVYQVLCAYLPIHVFNYINYNSNIGFLATDTDNNVKYQVNVADGVPTTVYNATNPVLDGQIHTIAASPGFAPNTNFDIPVLTDIIDNSGGVISTLSSNITGSFDVPTTDFTLSDFYQNMDLVHNAAESIKTHCSNISQSLANFNTIMTSFNNRMSNLQIELANLSASISDLAIRSSLINKAAFGISITLNPGTITTSKSGDSFINSPDDTFYFPDGLVTNDGDGYVLNLDLASGITADTLATGELSIETPSTNYTGLLGTIIGWLSDIWNRIGDVIGQIPTSISNLFTNISTLVSNSVGTITGWLNDILSRIGDVVTSIPSSLSNFLTNLTTLINTSVGTIVGAIAGTFENTIEPFKPYITGVFNLVSGYALYNGVFNHFLPQPVAIFLWVAWETSILVLIIRMIINRN